MTGKVIDVLVEEGHPVREGQILAHLDDTQARAALNYAEAQLASARKAAAEDEARLHQAELNLGRMQQLVKEQVVGKAELDQAQSDADSLKARIALHAAAGASSPKAQVRLQQANLDDTVVRAPFSGVAISKDAQPGEMISPVSAGGGFTRTGICTIVDMSSLEIEVDVNESYINRVQPGQKVEAVARRLSGLADPGARHHDDPVRGSAEGDGARCGSPSTSASTTLDPRILPDMGVKVAFLGDESPGTASAAAAPRADRPESRSAISGRTADRLRGERRPRRAARGQRRPRDGRSRSKCSRASRPARRWSSRARRR